MSTIIMNQCWSLKMTSTQKSVLISLADNANDEGVCWPSIARICERTCLSERAVQNSIKALTKMGILIINSRKGRSTVFQIIPLTPAPDAPHTKDTPAPDAPLPPHQMRDTPAPRAPRTIIEPPSEPSNNIVDHNKTNIPYQQIMDIYNYICGSILSRCLKLDKKRKANIQKCWNLEFDGNYPFHDLDFWEGYFNDCLENKFWCGDNDRGWKADIEFLTRPDKVLKVLEGG